MESSRSILKVKLSRLILILMAGLFFIGCGSNATKDKNPYGLDIINTTDAYLGSIAEDSSNLMVDLEKQIPGIKLDIRYADTNNFTHTKIYTSARAFLRKAAADSLLKIQQILAKDGIGIKVYDAYRPYSATVYFYEVYHDTTFVAAPWTGSIHNRGCAIDLALINLATGEDLAMPTPFDDFTEKASLNYNDLDSTVLANRSKLVNIMTSHGFTSYKSEWWHFNFKERDKFKLLDITFEQLEELK